MNKIKKHGLYVVIEGPEGVGKSTQVNLLAKRLQADGYLVRKFREPDSHTDITARSIRTITQNPFYPMNSKTEVLLYNAARSQSLENIRNSRSQGIICLCDRNYLTTLAVQYYGRGDIPDYETINTIISFAVGDMEPDITIVLDAPVIDLKKRTDLRNQGERFDNLDLAFLDRVRTGYLLEAKQRSYPVVSATDDPQKINNTIYDILHGVNATNNNSSDETTPPIPRMVNNPVATHIDGSKITTNISNTIFETTGTGQEYLEKLFTNTAKNVYAYTENLSTSTIASQLVKQIHRSGDLRTNLLNSNDTSSSTSARSSGGLELQFNSHYYIVENASYLLRKKIEWGRMATYIEQIDSKIHYDKKDKYGKYKYYVPDTLPKKSKHAYILAIDEIFTKYSYMLNELSEYIRKNSNIPKKDQTALWLMSTHDKACAILRNVLPVSAKTTIGVYTNDKAMEGIVMHLLQDDLPEAKNTGNKLLAEARKLVPNYLENLDNPEAEHAITSYNTNRNKAVKQLADAMQTGYSNNTKAVKLNDVWPRNELDIVPDILFEHSNLSLGELREHVASWTYKQKLDVFNAYIGDRQNRHQKPGRALEKIHYSWDIVCDYSSFCDLQRHRVVNDLSWQQLTPRYGYEIPELIEKAGIAEQYLDCFDISVELYNTLQQRGFELEAQYATLLGHKMRWKVTYNAREAFHIHELRTAEHQDEHGYRKLVLDMHEELLKVHPLIGEAMKFVGLPKNS